MTQPRLLLNIFVVTFVIGCSTEKSVEANDDVFWTEQNSTSKPVVALPDLTPIIKKLDQAVVHIQVSADVKPRAQLRGRPQIPGDPFSNPEDFFERFFGGPMMPNQPQQPRRSMGSGFIISKDGYIVTNHHVIDGGDKIEVSINFPNEDQQQKLTAKVVGTDPATDIALLKVDPKSDLPFAPLGNSSQLEKGEWVLAMGNPFGLSHSVSVGIVSAKGREISSTSDKRRFDDFIQTDAAINFGNSGGPLVNLNAEVVAINTAITAQGSGIGFAVPINIAKNILPQLKNKGSVARGYLGVMIQDVSKEIQEALKLKSEEGVLVNDLVEDGPAAASGLLRGDVIIEVQGQKTKNAKTLQRAVANIEPGNSIPIKVIRDGKEKKLNVKIGKLPGSEENKPAESKAGKVDRLGLAVQMREKDVVVVEVEPNSTAYEAGIGPGDIIQKINKQPVKSIKDYETLVKGLRAGKVAFFDLKRGNMNLYIAIRLPKS